MEEMLEYGSTTKVSASGPIPDLTPPLIVNDRVDYTLFINHCREGFEMGTHMQKWKISNEGGCNPY